MLPQLHWADMLIQWRTGPAGELRRRHGLLEHKVRSALHLSATQFRISPAADVRCDPEER